jgi:hypothetical protein
VVGVGNEVGVGKLVVGGLLKLKALAQKRVHESGGAGDVVAVVVDVVDVVVAVVDVVVAVVAVVDVVVAVVVADVVSDVW